MKLLDGQTVGIDLGTTFSSIAQLNSAGDPVSIRDTSGRVTVPSVVYLADDERAVVGPPQDTLLEARPEHIVEAIKRQMGNPKFAVTYGNRRMTPEFVSAMILKKLKQDAETQIGPIANAVITVPYYFNDLRRKATQDAGRIAGLNVIDIINEPTAATLAYAWIKGELGRVDLKQAERTIVVYDLGGGTFDVTVVRYSPTNFRVLATDGDVKLGGLDWSARMSDFVAEKFRKKFGADPRDDELSKRRLTKECEDAKRELSRRAQVPVTVSHAGKTTTIAVTRGEFEELTADLLQRTRDTTELVLELADVELKSLDDVILVGGSTHMPAVEEMLRKVCGRTPTRDVSPEEAVAQGAAVHAAILETKLAGVDSKRARAVVHRLQAVNTSNVNSHSLGVAVTDPRNLKRKFNHVMIPRNTPIPYRTSQRFATTVQNQQRIDISVLEGEAEDPEACVTIGEFQIRNLPEELPVGSPVEVSYEYDASGRIHVSARELVGNNEASARIVRESSLDDEGVRAFEMLARDYQVD